MHDCDVMLAKLTEREEPVRLARLRGVLFARLRCCTDIGCIGLAVCLLRECVRVLFVAMAVFTLRLRRLHRRSSPPPLFVASLALVGPLLQHRPRALGGCRTDASPCAERDGGWCDPTATHKSEVNE